MSVNRTSQCSELSRRSFIRNSGVVAAGLLFASRQALGGASFLSSDTGSGMRDYLQPSESAVMKGFIGRKLDLSYQNRILAQDVNTLVTPFRHRTETRLWQTEFWGKWFTSAVLAYKYRPEPALKKVLQTAVKDLIATQTPDGYIGNYKPENRLEQWDIWGRKYCLLGLLDYHDLTGDTNSLRAARKLTDHLIREINEKDGIIVNKGNYRGMAASSILEGIVRLYSLTGDKKYLAFAEKIVAQWETPGGPMLISKAGVNVSERFPKPESWYSWDQGQKAYEMMSCYEGLIELYRVTGKKEHLKAAEDTWNNIRDTEINIAGSGASYEMWFGGKKLQTSPVVHYQETCVTVTWIKFSQQLLRLTGNVKYAHAIEEAYYNALMGALNADGSDWAKYTPLNGERLPGSGQCGMELNCCVASGPRGQFTLPLTTVMSMKEGLSVNFFVEGSYVLKTPSGKKVTLLQQTDYPVSGKINLSMAMDAPEEMMIRIRIPAWSRQTTLKINDETIPVTPGEYATLKKVWTAKDVISLQLDMRGRVITQGTDHQYAAILRGPVVLARDTRLPGPDLGTTNTPAKDKEGYITLTPASASTDNIWLQYQAAFFPEFYKDATEAPKPAQITLCDYASAGNGKVPATFQVWMPQLYDPRKH
ncbi:beta-L-arabinofuranosidase domain-containing protein [Chitinophaga sp. MM2321]|uniref:glycoside hydrolase family 127 protein n=1 Tax=Chitinophaga sp. MM2321 TaxID=3137178 RepID=UPI0032D58A2C